MSSDSGSKSNIVSFGAWKQQHEAVLAGNEHDEGSHPSIFTDDDIREALMSGRRENAFGGGSEGSGLVFGDLDAVWEEDEPKEDEDEEVERRRGSITIRKKGTVVGTKKGGGKRVADPDAGNQHVLFEPIDYLLEETKNLPFGKRPVRYKFLRAVVDSFVEMVQKEGGLKGVRDRIRETGGRFRLEIVPDDGGGSEPEIDD